MSGVVFYTKTLTQLNPSINNVGYLKAPDKSL